MPGGRGYYHQLFLKLALFGCLCFVMQWTMGRSWAQELEVPDSWAAPEALIHIDSGSHDHPGMSFAVIVDKSRQQINLYRYDGYWRLVAKWSCSTGRVAGPKEMEGDQRTPEGVYFATRNVGQRYLTETYGARALPLDYPNWLDRHLSRTGSAIWLHGTSKPLQERDSNGCIVLENPTINRLAHYIRLNRTPVIIVERVRLQAVKEAHEVAGTLLSAAGQWHEAMMHGSYDEFRRWYGNHAAPSMQWWRQWCRQRRNGGVQSAYRSLMGQRAIYKCGDYYVLLFDHHLRTACRSEWVGRRKLYLSLIANRVRIIGDTFQAAPVRRKDPLIHAWRKLWKEVPNERKVAAKPKIDQDT